MKALVETIDEGLKVLKKKRMSTVGTGHCLMWAWPKGFHIPKSSVEAALSGELLSHGCFLSRSSLRVMLKTYLEEKMYREDDMDILLNALANAYHCKVILYQYKNQSSIVDTISPGRVESEKELEFLYLNEHYELIHPFSETVEFNEHSKHPSINEPFNGIFFEEHLLLKHFQIRQIQSYLILPKASHIYMKIFNFLFLVEEQSLSVSKMCIEY